MKLVLIGIQGAGKSTQGNMLSQQLKLPYLSTGHIFREIAKEKTKLGRYVKVLMSAGTLIPDEKVIEIVNDYLSKPVYENGYILDGFPRTVAQAKKFKNNVDKVILLNIPDKEALWRLAYRNDNRDDNTIQAIRNRIELFHRFTTPVLDYYNKKGKLVEIDGTKAIDKVNQEILKSLGKQKIRNRIHDWEHKKKTIIAIVGMPGSGKTEATQYLKEKHKLPVISFSNVVNDYVKEHFKRHTNANHHKVRVLLRKKHGFEAMAKLSQEKIRQTLEASSIVLIEGMRSWEEYIYLETTFSNTDIVIVAVHADKNVRYDRIAKRKDRKKLSGRDRDIQEMKDTNMGPTIAFADYIIDNNYTKMEFKQSLEKVYREIYYT